MKTINRHFAASQASGHRHIRTAIALVVALFLGGVAFAGTPPLRVNGVKYGISDNAVYVTVYGCKGDGSTDDTACFQSAATAATAGTTVYIPSGTYLLTDTVTWANSYVHVVGAGTQAVTIKFNPASAKTAFKFSAGASTLYGASLEGMTFVSTGTNTQTKTAVEVDDTSGFVMRDVWVDPRNASTWTGSGSVGLHLYGRELTTVERFRAFTDKPIVLSNDPNTSGIVDNDHLHMTDIYVRPTPGSGNDCIHIDGDLLISNLTLDGYQSWIVDKNGLAWSETSAPSVHINVNISGVRCEQAVDSTGYCVYINTTQNLQNLDIHDSYMPSGQNGIHLGGGVQNATIENVVFPANVNTLTHLDIGSGVSDLNLVNNFVNSGGVTNLGSMVLVSAMPQRITSATMPSTAYYVDSATAAARGINMSAVLTAQSNIIKNSSTANTNPLTFDTINTYSGGSRMVVFKNGGTEKAYVDGVGSLVSVSGLVDSTGSQLCLGCNTAGSVALGLNGSSSVFIRASGLTGVTAGGTTIGGGGAYMADVRSRHFTGQGSAPAIAAGTGAGTSPTISLTGTDAAGKISLTLGSSPAGSNATVATVTFSSAYGINAPYCQIHEANAAAAALSGTSRPFVDSASTSTSLFVLKSGSTALAGGPFLWTYDCTQ